MSEQSLALAVLRRAVLDATNPHLPATVRRGARAFLVGGHALEFWAMVAGVSGDRVRRMARQL